MENIKFESPSFRKRIKGMLGVDLYRLFHTPMFYIFLAIAAIIPAMVLTMTGMENPDGVTKALYDNTWQIIAADSPLYVVKGIAQYANMNMVFIFGGIMLSIFIGNDYRSGYIKQLITNHPKRQDYMISKSIIGVISMASMCITYLIGSVIAGLISDMAFKVSASSLIFALLGKIIMSIGWASLYTFINVVFRKKFGVSILLSFILGTGIIIIGAAAVVGNSSILNIFLYGSSVYACLSSGVSTIFVCLLVSIFWGIVYNYLGTKLLSKCDIY